MSEKLYKIVSGVGAGSIALGIITLVTGVTTGVLMIVNGARLLKGKSDMMHRRNGCIGIIWCLLWKSEGSGYIGNSWAHLRYLPIFSEM